MREGETMRRKKMLVVVALFAMLFGLAQNAGASIIPNHFVSTSNNSNIINVNFGSNGLADGWYFGIYDFGGSESSGLDLLLGSNTLLVDSANFEVTYVFNHYQIKVTKGIDLNQTLDIGNSDDFSFYFRDNSGSIYDTDLTITGGGLNYGFSSTNGGNVAGADLASVPLVSSAIFLFSGFAGLVAFGSRRKIKK